MHFFIFLVSLLAFANASPLPGIPFNPFSGGGRGNGGNNNNNNNNNGGNAAANPQQGGNNNGGNGATNSQQGENGGTKVDPAAAAAASIQVDPGFDAGAAKQAEQEAAAKAAELAGSPSAQKVAQLKMASTGLQRLDIMSEDADWKFDFNTVKAEAVGEGGNIVTANAASFPPTEITGTSMAVGILGPCGFATPHSHPRANELNLVTEGTLVSAMTLENKARVINQTIGLYQMTAFPQGAMHMEFNPGCNNATFVAMFSANDAGVQQSMNAFVNFGDEVVKATMGGSMTVNGKDIDTFRNEIPVNVANGVDSCLQACGLKKRSLEESREILKRGLPSRTRML